MIGPAGPRALTDPSLLDVDVVAAELGVDPASGLSDEEAARRRIRDGPNELSTQPPPPRWRRLLAQFHNPLIYLLLAAAAVSFAAWIVEGAEGVPIDALVIGAILALNAALGYVQEARAADAVAALATMTTATSTVLRGGERTTIPSADLVRGDVLVLSEGDAVGADARLFSAGALRVHEASLTGESATVEKIPATMTRRVALGDRTNMVYRGTAVSQGVGRALVTSVGMSTEMGKVASMLHSTAGGPTPLQSEVDRVGRTLSVVVIIIAVVVVVTIIAVEGITTVGDTVGVLLLGVSLAVAAVPEGLPTILSLVLAIGVQRLARHHAVVKDLSSVETLGSATVICTDKTGTLTKNEMTAQRVSTFSGRAELSGVGYRPEGSVTADGEPLEGALLTEVALVLLIGQLANDAQLAESDGQWHIWGDPTEAALLVAARKLPAVLDDAAGFVRRAEIPFTSDRKMMSTLDASNGRLQLFSKGAPDVLVANCSRLQVGGGTIPLTHELREKIRDDAQRLSAKAYRTIGFARRPLAETVAASDIDDSLEHDMIYVGVVGMIDPPREDAARAISEARRAGVRIIMMTGDHPSTAARIAFDLGIVDSWVSAVTGPDIDAVDDPGLLRDITRRTSIYARLSPRHKLRIVDALQDDGNVVAMTGDGVNDAPALKSADIGIAMGITGTQVAKDAARMILLDEDFSTIVRAIREGRVIFDNVKKFLRYLLSSNFGEVLTVFFGVLLAGLIGLSDSGGGQLVLPLLATQILWINLITDSAPALAMGVDRGAGDVMSRSPRSMDEPAIDRRMWRGILSIGLVMAFASLFAIDLFLPGGLVDGDATLDVARTAGFTTLVFAQLFNALNARSETVSAFAGLFANRWLWAAIGMGVVLQVAVVEVPFLQAAFGTAPLDLVQWGACVALASLVLWYDELRKLVLRMRARNIHSGTTRKETHHEDHGQRAPTERLRHRDGDAPERDLSHRRMDGQVPAGDPDVDPGG